MGVTKIGTKYNALHAGKKLKPTLVNVYTVGGYLVQADVPLGALRRFSEDASYELPYSSMTSDTDDTLYTYNISDHGDRHILNPPFAKVIQWIIVNHHAKKPTSLGGDVVPEEESLIFNLETIAVCKAMGLTIWPFALASKTERAIREKPISAKTLQTIWELFPANDNNFLRAAVESLTHHYRFEAISEAQNAELEAFFQSIPELEVKFTAEYNRQIRKHSAWVRGQKFLASKAAPTIKK